METGWRKNYLRYKAYFLNVGVIYRENNALKVYLEIILSLVTVSVFAVFALRPTLLTIAQLIKEIEVRQETLEKMNKKIRNIHAAQMLYDQMRSKIVYLDTAMPATSSVDVFARQIEGLTLKNGTSLSSITVDETVIYGKEKASTAKEDKKKVPFPNGANNITFEIITTTDINSYGKLYAFVQDAERLRWPIRVDDLTIRKAFDKDKNEILELDLKGRLPYITK